MSLTGQQHWRRFRRPSKRFRLLLTTSRAQLPLGRCLHAPGKSVSSDLMPDPESKVCASLTIPADSQHESLSASWKHIWQLATRSVSLPSTSRAACALLHYIMKSALVPVRDTLDDVNQIITTADSSGPAVLTDSSLNLMLSMLRLRNVMFPNASQSTSNHVIRWVFIRWRPSECEELAFLLVAGC